MGAGLLSEVLIKNNFLLLTVKDRGSVYVDWLHKFPSRILKPEEREELCKLLSDYNPVKYDRIPQFNIMQVTAPIEAAKTLPNKFLRGYYTKTARWRYAIPWAVVDVDEKLEKIFDEKRAIDSEVSGIFDLMVEALRNSKRAKRYRIKHFEENVAENWQGLDDILDEGLRQRRARLEQATMEFDEKLRAVCANSALNPKNKCIDVLLPDTGLITPPGRTITADEILSSKIYFFDIEKPLFGTPDEEVSWLAEIWMERGAVARKAVKTTNSLDDKLEGWQTRCFANPGEMVARTAEEIAAPDSSRRTVDIIVAYNSPFDVGETRDAGEFCIGERESEPKVEVSMDFFRKMKVYGKMIIDPMRWARIAYGYLPNRKLEMIVRHALGRDFAKDIDYEQLADLERILKTGNVSHCRQKTLDLLKERESKNAGQDARATAFNIIRKYVTKDVEVLRELFFSQGFRKFLEDCCWMSNHFRVDVSRLMHSPNTINDAQERCYEKNVGTQRVVVYLKTRAMMRLEAMAMRHFEEIMHGCVEGNSRAGLHQGVYKLFIPAGDFLQDAVCTRFDEAKAFFEYKSRFLDDKQRQYTLSQYANALARYIIVDYARQKKEAGRFEELLNNYRLDESDFNSCRNSLKISIRKNSEHFKYALNHLEKGNLKEKTVSKYLPDRIRQVLAQKNIDAAGFTELLQLYAKRKKLERKVGGQYAVPVWKIDDLLKSKFAKVNEFLHDNGFEVVHKQGNFVYVKGGSEQALLDRMAPLILADKIDSVYVATNPSDTKTRGQIREYESKIYYFRHGYPEGIKLKDEPDSLNTIYEMRCYRDTLKAVLAGDFSGALKSAQGYLGRLRGIVKAKEEEIKGLEQMLADDEKHVIDRDNYEHLIQNAVSKQELVWFRKEGRILADGSQPKQPRYSAFENGGKIYFYEKEEHAQEKQILFDGNLKRKYVVEIKDEKKEEKIPGDPKNQRRVYIMPVSELKPDVKMYYERLKDRMRDFIEPITGFSESIDFVSKDYSDERIEELVKKNSLGLYLT